MAILKPVDIKNLLEQHLENALKLIGKTKNQYTIERMGRVNRYESMSSGFYIHVQNFKDLPEVKRFKIESFFRYTFRCIQFKNWDQPLYEVSKWTPTLGNVDNDYVIFRSDDKHSDQKFLERLITAINLVELDMSPEIPKHIIDSPSLINNKNFNKKEQLFANADEINRRIALLNQPHMIQLTQFVKQLRLKHPDGVVPDFDPLDGGINAKVLFLLEKPGPKTDRNTGGSGFISRDNYDMTANATRVFLDKAGIRREDSVLWNLIPVWNNTIDTSANEINVGFKYLEELLLILKNVKVIVLVGKNAQKAYKLIDKSKYHVIESLHPGPRVRASQRDKWFEISEEWAKVKDFI